MSSSSVKIGKIMLVVAWGLLLAGLTLVFGRWEQHQYNPNRQLTAKTGGPVILERNRFNHYVASGHINGTPVVFLLDTGATSVAVPAKLAASLDLRPGRAHMARTANGLVQVYDTQLDRLQIGSITLKKVRASINPGMSGDEILLGMSALKELEFTQRGSTLTLKHVH